MKRVRVEILKSFRHQYGDKDVILKPSTPYYIDVSEQQGVEELLYMMSANFPYRHFISIEMGPELMSILDVSSFDVRDAPPPNPQVGRVYYNTMTGKAYIWNGSEWLDMTCCGEGGGGGGNITTIPALFGDVNSDGFSNEVQITPGVIVDSDVAPDAGIKLSKLEKNPLDRANHIGQQPASTISDFYPAVKTVRINEMSPPSGNLNMSGFRIVNLADPISGSDAATKDYVDNALQNLGFTTPLPLNKGGTGVAANSNIEALNALEGIYSGNNLGNAVDGARLYASKTPGSGTTPSVLNFRRIKVTAPLTIVENTDYIEIGMGGTGTLDINQDLVGYPLQVDKGGTGASTPINARINLGAVGDAENALADATNIGNVFKNKPVGTDTLKFRSLVEKPGGGIDLDQQADRINISVEPNAIPINDLNGAIDLAGNKITGVLPITKGGTGATTAAQARDNLNVVRSAISLGGTSILGNPIKNIDNDLQFKGLVAGANITLTPTGNTIEISAIGGATGATASNIGSGAGEPYHSSTGSVLNFRNIKGGSGIAVTNGTTDIELDVVAQNIGGGASVLQTPLNTAVGSPINLKTIVEGNGVTITETNSEVTINALLTNVSNVGAAPGQVFRDITGGVVNLRTIGPAPTNAGITVTTVGDEVHLQTDIVDATNVGTGEEVLKEPITTPAATLELRSLTTPNNSLTQDGLEVSTAGDEVHFQTNIANVESLGAGADLYQDPITGPGATVSFRSLIPAATDPGITITQDTEEIVFQTDIVDAENIGTGLPILDETFVTPGATLQFRSLLAGGAINLTNPTANEIQISGYADNLGGQEPILKNPTPAVGEPFNFKTLQGGAGINFITTNPDVIEIEATSNNLINVGAGSQVYKGLNGTDHEFRTLNAGNGIVIAENGDVIDITPYVGNIDNTGGIGESLISTIVPLTDLTAGSTVEFKTLVGGNNITLTPTADSITIDADGVITNAANIGGAPGQSFSAINADTVEFRTIGPAIGDRINVLTNGDVIELDVNEANLDLSQIGGGPLPIAAGGTGSTTPAGARSALDVVYEVVDDSGVSGLTLISGVTNPAGDGKTVSMKSLVGVDGITVTDAGADIQIGDTPPTGEYGITTTTTAGVTSIVADAVNVGITGEDVLANPGGAATDPMQFKKITAGDGISVTTTANDEIEVATSGATGYASPALAPTDSNGGAGPWKWNITHNLGLPAPYNSFVINAYDVATGEVEYPSNINGIDANTAEVIFNSNPGANLYIRLMAVV